MLPFKDYVADESVQVVPVNRRDIPMLLRLAVDVFADQMPEGVLVPYLYSSVNWDKSFKALVGGKMVGGYLLGDEQVLNFAGAGATEDLRKYRGKVGVEGVALFVLPEYRGKRVGDALRRAPLGVGYDYIWGQHLKTLNNLGQWTKFGRRLVADVDGVYVTLMDLK